MIVLCHIPEPVSQRKCYIDVVASRKLDRDLIRGSGGDIYSTLQICGLIDCMVLMKMGTGVDFLMLNNFYEDHHSLGNMSL